MLRQPLYLLQVPCKFLFCTGSITPFCLLTTLHNYRNVVLVTTVKRNAERPWALGTFSLRFTFDLPLFSANLPEFVVSVAVSDQTPLAPAPLQFCTA